MGAPDEEDGKKGIMRLLLCLLTSILNFIFAIMKLLPVRAKITFISRQSDRMTEDMRLLRSALEQKYPELQLVFLCKTMGNAPIQRIAYSAHILRQMLHIATSEIVVIDSYCIAVSALRQRPSLVVVQMWHALGSLKKFGRSIVGEGEGRSQWLADALHMHRHYTWILASSERCAPYFAEAFGYDLSSVKVLPLPRTDRLRDPDYQERTRERIYRRYSDWRDTKIVLYAPTFRRDHDISAAIDALAQAFASYGSQYTFVVKKHPLMREELPRVATGEGFTTQQLLCAADYVICDYSATIIEAAVMGKPLFFYTFDFERYNGERSFYINYREEMPGLISPDPLEIAKAIRDERYDPADILAFAQRYVAPMEHCTERLADFLAFRHWS